MRYRKNLVKLAIPLALISLTLLGPFPSAHSQAQPAKGQLSATRSLSSQTNCVPAPFGLVSWWPGDGSGNDVFNRNPGTLEGGVTFAKGEVGQAFSFNGVDGRVHVPNNPNLNPGLGSVTVGAWINQSALVPYQRIIWKNSGGLPFNGYYIAANHGTVAFGIGDGTFVAEANSSGIVAKTWNHVVGSYDRATNTASLYINGVLSNQVNRALGDVNSASDFYISSQVGITEFFNGSVDEVQLYNRALTSAEVQSIFNARNAGVCKPGCDPSPSGLVSWWPLDGNANDNQGNNHGAVVGSGGQFVPGEVGQGFQSGGPGSLVRVNDTTSLNPPQFTIDAWAKINALTTSDMPIVWKGNAQGFDVTASYSLEVFGNPGSFSFPPGSIISGTPAIGKAFFTIDNGTFDQVLVSNAPIAIGSFIHYAVSADGASIRLYINGTLNVQASQLMTPKHSPYPFQIGSANGTSVLGFFWNGIIDEIHFFNRALSATEIQSIFGAGSAGTCPCVTRPPSLVGWWTGDGNGKDIVAGNDAVLLGHTTFSAAEVGQGFNFSSDVDGATIANKANLNVTGSGFTADFWMKGVKNQPQPLFLVVDKSHGFVDSEGWVFQGDSTTGSISFLIGAGGPGTTNFPGVGSSVNVLDGNFHHIAGTWNGTTVLLYVDGVLQGSAALSTPANNNRDVHMGFAWGGGTPTRFFRGIEDELHIFNRALTASEIQSIFNAGGAGVCHCLTPPTGLVSWWPGDGNANDIIGSHNGVLMNGAGFVLGKVGQAFNFNGINQFVNVTKDPAWNLGSNPFTIDLWVKFNQPPGHAGFIGQDERPGNFNKWFFGMNPLPTDTGLLTFAINGPSLGPITTVSAPWTPNAGQWYHVAVTRETSGVYTLYINGVNAASATNTTPIPSVAANLIIGAASWPLNGQIDEVQVFNRALSAAEIGNVFTIGSFGCCKPAAVLAQPPPIPVTSCQALTSAGSTYTLTNSIAQASSINGGFGNEYTCMLIAAPNITFNLNGFNITDTRQSGDDCCPIQINSVNDTVTGPGTIRGTYGLVSIAPLAGSEVPSSYCHNAGGPIVCNQNATVRGVTLLGNSDTGIGFSDSICGTLSCQGFISNGDFILGNTISFISGIGIDLYTGCCASGITIANNIITHNGIGVRVPSPGNLIYNNFFDNTVNAQSQSAGNSWNTTKTPGPNIVGGPFIGGNFWSDYNGTDSDGDGFGDTLLPFNSTSNIALGGDYLPLFSQGFGLSVNPISVGPIQAGSSGVSLITIAGNKTFSSYVSLKAQPSSIGLDASLGTASLKLTPPGSNGTSLTLSTSTPGSYSVTVTATAGIVTHSVTVAVIVVAALHPTSVSISCAPNPIPTGAPTTCTATVNDPTTGPTTPNGFIVFTLVSGSGAFNSTLCTLSGQGASASCQVTYTYQQGSIPVGGVINTIGSAYGGDSFHRISLSGAYSVTIIERNTISSLSCLPSSVSVNKSTVCSVIVTDVSPGISPDPLAGQVVSFYTNSIGRFSSTFSVQNQCQLAGTFPVAACSLNYTATQVGSGIHRISITYSFYTNASFSNFNLTVTLPTMLASSTSSLLVNEGANNVAGTSFHDNATVTGVLGTTPSGTVVYRSFMNGNCASPAATMQTVTLSGGLVPNSLSTGPLAAGSYSFQASYSGDTNYSPSTSSCEPFTVTKANPTIGTTIFGSCLPNGICSLPVTSVQVGETVKDQATLTGGFPTSGVTGTVNYTFFSNGNCAALGVSEGIVPVAPSNSVAGSSLVTPTPVGSYSFNATYSGDPNNNPATSGCEALTVTKASPNIGTTLSATTITIGGSATDNATLVAGFNPTGSITYTAYTDPFCISNVAFTDTEPLGTPSKAFTPTATGGYFWKALYSGDANNNGVASAFCGPGTAGEVLTVGKASPSIRTILSPATITLGGSASDLATVSGGFSVSGTVTYTAYSNAGCTTQVFTDTEPVGTASKSFTPTAAGSYYWNATYHGDVNNNATSTVCGASGETLTVATKPDFTLTPTSTTVTVAANLLASDKLRVDAINGFTGTVSFVRVGSVFGGVSYDCSSVTLSPTIVSANSTCTFSSNTPGTYTAIVNGTGGTPLVFHLVTYTVVVVKQTPSIHTALSASTITVGQSVTDSATLTGTDLLTASGTVTYQFFSGSSCGGTPTIVGTPVAVNSGVIPTSVSQTLSSAGQYSWNAVYSGDASNNGATGQCEPLTVNKATPHVTSTVTPQAITVGSSATDLAAVSGFTPTGTVTYTVYSDSSCTTSVFISASIPLGTASGAFTPTTAGTYYWVAAYSGDSNNNGAATTCGAVGETLIVSAVAFDYSLSVSPVSASIIAGSSTSAIVTATLTSGSAQPVTLLLLISPNPSVCQVISGPSPCGTISFSPTTITPSSNGATSTLTISTTGIVPLGTYILTITGSPAGSSHSSPTFTLTISAPSLSTVGCGHDLSCYVQSNATLTHVKFAGITIHAEADGPKGTHGYANITVPKTAIHNIDNLHVFVDNSKLARSDVTITSNSTDYFIYFTFTFHSPVQIDIQLTTPENAPSLILGLDRTLFYEIVGALVAVVVVIVALGVMASRRRSKASNIPRQQ